MYILFWTGSNFFVHFQFPLKFKCFKNEIFYLSVHIKIETVIYFFALVLFKGWLRDAPKKKRHTKTPKKMPQVFTETLKDVLSFHRDSQRRPILHRDAQRRQSFHRDAQRRPNSSWRRKKTPQVFIEMLKNAPILHRDTKRRPKFS